MFHGFNKFFDFLTWEKNSFVSKLFIRRCDVYIFSKILLYGWKNLNQWLFHQKERTITF